MGSDAISLKYDPISGMSAKVGDTRIENLKQIHVYWDDQEPIAVITVSRPGLDILDLVSPEMRALLEEINDD